MSAAHIPPRPPPRNHVDNSRVDVDILLPYGILIPLTSYQSQKLVDLKQKVWQEAPNYPLFKLLKYEPSRYLFSCINNRAELIELFDETKTIAEVKPYRPIFKMIERVGDREEKEFNSKMSVLIGKGVYEMEKSAEEEVVYFRAKMLEKSKLAVTNRQKASWDAKAFYKYAPEMDPIGGKLPRHIVDDLPADKSILFRVYVYVTQEHFKRLNEDIVAKIEDGPDILARNVTSVCSSFNIFNGKKPNDFVFKIYGKEECLLGTQPLINYEYIRNCILSHKTPELIFLLKSDLDVTIDEKFPVLPPPALPSSPRNTKFLWDLIGSFQVKAVEAKGLNVSTNVQIQLFCGLFHGNTPLSDIKSTRMGHGSNPTWNENVVFDQMDYLDIPRGARLCSAIYDTGDGKSGAFKKRSNKVPLAWVNIPMFDYRNLLRTGRTELTMWNMDENETTLEDTLNPIGIAGANPTGNIRLVLEFVNTDKLVRGPDIKQMIDYGNTLTIPNKVSSKYHIDELIKIIDKDPLAELTDQDSELVWKMRSHLLNNNPKALPKLLTSLKWNVRDQVAYMHLMLKEWPCLSPSEALQLLDYKFQEPAVRSFAVKKCLEKATDEELLEYLLQLVQALKYEAYLDCELAEFLLERAWSNRRIGHYLFWYLRAEMKSPIVHTRFGLLLEAYCRGSINHLPSLLEQIEAVRVMKTISKSIQGITKKGDIKATFVSMLENPANQKVLTTLTSTLNPAFKLNEFIFKNCRCFDSKMKPLLLSYDSTDSKASQEKTPLPISIIFKRGDDLRQDMLTLQIFQTMDKIWQEAGVYLKILPYGCIATSKNTGFIEAVQESDTIANIQKNAGHFIRVITTRAKGSSYKAMYDWLKQYNVDRESLAKAVENFTLSCAAYCVATYVLGIGDRHSDNIMLKKNGQLFHIDFGHFLGNFKSKFGFRRERVPFVMTYDFIYIICNGKDANFSRSEDYKKFAGLCEVAYLELRKKAGVLLNLLAMMLSTGIPQLQTVNDLSYVRDALVLNSSEEEARKHFSSQMAESLDKSWSTSMNWFFHSLAKDNRAKN